MEPERNTRSVLMQILWCFSRFKKLVFEHFFTARRHASAVYAVVVCLSVCLYVCHKWMFY